MRNIRSSRNVPVLDHLLEVAMGGANDSHVDMHGLVITESSDLTCLKHAEQLGLHRQRQFTDFIQEDGAAVGDFEQAGA